MSTSIKNEVTIANKIVSLYKSRSAKLNSLRLSFYPLKNGSCKVWVTLAFMTPINNSRSLKVSIPNCETCKVYNRKSRKYSFVINDFSMFAYELYPLFKFAKDSLNVNFTVFGRAQSYAPEIYQEPSFSLSYHLKEALPKVFRHREFLFPANRQLLPDEFPDCIGNKIVEVLRNKLAHTDSLGLIICPDGKCSLMVFMDKDIPSRSKSVDGLNFKFKPDEKRFAINFTLDRMESLSKLFWYLQARHYIMYTSFSDEIKSDIPNRILFIFQKEK